MKNELNFEKRMDLWREYRDEINKESLKLSNPFHGDTRLSKLVKNIYSIDPNILSNVKFDLDVSSGNNAIIDFSSKYETLTFSLDKLDGNLLNNISNTISNAQDLKKKRFVIDEKGNLISGALEKIERLDNMLQSIETKISEMNKVIQYFPKTASQNLQVLETSLKIVKDKKEPISASMKVDSSEPRDSRDLKIPFFISLGGLGITMLMAIVMIILIIV